MLNKKKLLDTLSHYQPILLKETPIAAAVMVMLLFTNDNQIEIVLTKRASTLPTYAGHVSFPGGIRDATDKDLKETGEREVLEELSISPENYQHCGQLNDFLSHDGNLVRPFVVAMSKNVFEKLQKKSDDEIETIYYFPLNQLKNIKHDPILAKVTRRRPSYSFTEGKLFIWGLTATILQHLFTVIASDLST